MVTQLSGGGLWDAEDVARSSDLDASLKRNANRKLNTHTAMHTNTRPFLPQQANRCHVSSCATTGFKALMSAPVSYSSAFCQNSGYV